MLHVFCPCLTVAMCRLAGSVLIHDLLGSLGSVVFSRNEWNVSATSAVMTAYTHTMPSATPDEYVCVCVYEKERERNACTLTLVVFHVMVSLTNFTSLNLSLEKHCSIRQYSERLLL